MKVVSAHQGTIPISSSVRNAYIDVGRTNSSINESCPGEFQPTGGFTDDATVEGGRVAPGDLPGIGLEGKSAFHRILRALHD